MKISSWIDRLRRYIAKKAPKNPKVKKKNRDMIHKTLLFRLKILSFCLLGLAFFFLTCAITNPPLPKEAPLAPQVEELSAGFPDIDSFEEDSTQEILNFYMISLVFFTLGFTCFLTSYKQRKK